MSLQSADLVVPISLSTGEQRRHTEARLGYITVKCLVYSFRSWGGNLMKEQGLRMEDPGVLQMRSTSETTDWESNCCKN